MIDTVSNGNMILTFIQGSGEGALLKIDTGSPITILSYNDAYNVLGKESNNINNILKNADTIYKFDAYNSNSSVKAVKCYFKNVLVGNERIDKFYFYLNTDIECKSTSLLGMDFIEKCTGNLNTGGNLTLNYQRWYKSNNDVSDYAFIGSLEHESRDIKNDKLFLSTSLPEIL